MSAGPPAQPNRTKIRLGLALVSVVVIVSIVLAVILDDTVGRAVMFAVAVTALVRAFLLTRALRADRDQ